MMANSKASKDKMNSKLKCGVLFCGARSSKDLALSFHSLPKPRISRVKVQLNSGRVIKMDRRKAWRYALSLPKNVNLSFRVCSRHFEEDDYILSDDPKMPPELKPDSVPSLDLPKNRPLSDCVRRRRPPRRHLEPIDKDEFLKRVVKEIPDCLLSQELLGTR